VHVAHDHRRVRQSAWQLRLISSNAARCGLLLYRSRQVLVKHEESWIQFVLATNG